MTRKLLRVAALLVLCAAPAGAKPIHVGKALRKTAAVVSAPARHPMTSAKLSITGVYTGLFAGVEAVGATLEVVGTGVQKVGGYIYDVGEVLAGGKGK